MSASTIKYGNNRFEKKEKKKFPGVHIAAAPFQAPPVDHKILLPGIHVEVFLQIWPDQNAFHAVGSNQRSIRRRLTSEKYVVTTVRSENFRPASAFNASVADFTLSNLT